MNSSFVCVVGVYVGLQSELSIPNSFIKKATQCNLYTNNCIVLLELRFNKITTPIFRVSVLGARLLYLFSLIQTTIRRKWSMQKNMSYITG